MQLLVNNNPIGERNVLFYEQETNRSQLSLNASLAEGGFSLHPDKTQIGKLTNGFDWLGGWYNEQGRVGIAPRALHHYRTRSLRLYEQARRLGYSHQECLVRVQNYRVRWRRCFI
ncbi:hypothetical protein ACTXE8_000510 [Vibrio cholerae]